MMVTSIGTLAMLVTSECIWRCVFCMWLRLQSAWVLCQLPVRSTCWFDCSCDSLLHWDIRSWIYRQTHLHYDGHAVPVSDCFLYLWPHRYIQFCETFDGYPLHVLNHCLHGNGHHEQIGRLLSGGFEFCNNLEHCLQHEGCDLQYHGEHLHGHLEERLLWGREVHLHFDIVLHISERIAQWSELHVLCWFDLRRPLRLPADVQVPPTTATTTTTTTSTAKAKTKHSTAFSTGDTTMPTTTDVAHDVWATSSIFDTFLATQVFDALNRKHTTQDISSTTLVWQ